MPVFATRVPRIDWSVGFARHWNGSPAATHLFNTLSFLFPDGEQYFITVARETLQTLPPGTGPALAEAVKGFMAQESIHSRQHALYNAVLESQGYTNVVRGFALKLQHRSFQRSSALTRLAIVCAYEHYTAVLSNFLLSNWSVIAAAPEEMATLWGWHAAEETEHKAVCFDLYQAAGGHWLHRILTFGIVTANFFLLFSRLYWDMLRRDGALRWRKLPATVRDVASLFFGRRGVGWHVLFYALAYLSPRFHPWQQANQALLQSWLATHGERLEQVRSP
jgi:predicted metal-dependent hydrolase